MCTQVSVQFQEQRLTVTIQDTSGQEEYKLDTELYGKVRPGSHLAVSERMSNQPIRALVAWYGTFMC